MTSIITPSRAEYEALLVALHQEMRAGRGEEARAEDLRSAMADLWYGLSDDEQDLVDELSEDLYIVEGKRAVVPLAEGETPEAVQRGVEKALKAEENRRALSLIRKLPNIDARAAAWIGIAWKRLVFPRAAACFFDFANELEPKASFEVMALEALLQAGALEEAAARAEAIEKRPIVSGTLLLEVASVLHRTMARVEEPRCEAVYRHIVRLVEVAWDDRTALASIRAMGLVVAGFAYQHLGASDLALRAFERAVAAHPSEAPLLARGLALLHLDRPRALKDFTEAVKLGTRFDWPYLYASLHALETERFVEVERVCAAGLAIARRPEVRGRLFEWWAIAAAALGQPASEVTALFDRAAAELPLDLVIRRNARRYQEHLVIAQAVPANDWELSPAIDEAEAWTSIERAA